MTVTHWIGSTATALRPIWSGSVRLVMPVILAAPIPSRRRELLDTIESEIIPRLLAAHEDNPVTPKSCGISRMPPTEAEIATLATIATQHDLARALAMVETMCRDGMSLEDVLLGLVAPAARYLGEQWNDDTRSFTEVSAGLGTLQQVVHVLSPTFAPALPNRGMVLLVAAPGEQHTLGLFLVGEFLRRAGFGVHIDPTMPEPELLRIVSTRRVEMVGITVSTDNLLSEVPPLVAKVRQLSLNRTVSILLGGALDLNEIAGRCGASVCSSDPRDAVRFLEVDASLREHGG